MTDTTTVARTAIAQAAEAAHTANQQTGQPVQCPYPTGSADAAAFHAHVQRLQLASTDASVEGSA